MSPFVTLSCPSCGGKLQITEDIDRFACAHCGQEHIVKRSGGIVTLAPVVDAIKRVEVGVDKTAAELAMARLEREIHDTGTERNRLAAESPRPGSVADLLGITGLGIGILTLACTIVLGLSQGWGSIGGVIVIGVGLILLGALFLLFSHAGKEGWDQSTGQKLKQLDQMIVSKQAEWSEIRKRASPQ